MQPKLFHVKEQYGANDSLSCRSLILSIYPPHNEG